MRTPDGYHSCDRCGATGLRSVFASGGGSDLCGTCRSAKNAPETVPLDPLAPWHSVNATPETIRAHAAKFAAAPTVRDGGVVDAVPGPDRFVWRDAPDFLPIGGIGETLQCYVRVANVYEADVVEDGIRLSWTHDPDFVDVRAPYFAAWLDRLGIPWTEELRKAHAAAGKGEA